MTSAYSDIRAALENALDGITSATVVYENTRVDVAPGESYVFAQLNPSTRRPNVLGPDPEQRHDGVFNLRVCTPESGGPGPGASIADEIIATMDATADITHGSTTVRVRYAELGVAFPDPPHYCTPVVVGWFAYE